MRTGRASTALLDGHHVDYYGAQTPLNQLASLSAPEPTPAGDPALRQERHHGASRRPSRRRTSGLNPQNDGKLIRVPIPPLTEERRRELVKHVRKVAEELPRLACATTGATPSRC